MKLREIEQRELLAAVQQVKDRRNLRQVEMLSHLHRAAEATRNRFHDALANYHDRNTDRNSRTVQQSDAEQDQDDGEEWYGAERTDMVYGFPYRAGRTMRRMSEAPAQAFETSIDDDFAKDEPTEVMSPSQHGGRGSPHMLFGGSSSASSPYGGGVTQNLLQQQLQRHSERLQQQQQQLPEMSSRPVFGSRSRSLAQLSAPASQAIRAELGFQSEARRTNSGHLQPGRARSRDRSESPGRRFSKTSPAFGNIYAEAELPPPAFAPAATAHAPWRRGEASTSSPSPPPGYPAMPGQGLRGPPVGTEQVSVVLGRVPSGAALEPLHLATSTLRPSPEGEEVQPFLAQSLSSPHLSPQASGPARGQMSEDPAHKRGLARGSRLRRSLHVDVGDENRQFCVIPLRSQASMANLLPS